MIAKVESPAMLIRSSGSICTATRSGMRRAYGFTLALSPLPDIDEAPRPAARDDEDRVDPHVVAFTHIAGCKPLGCNCHSAQTPFVERECGSVRAPAGFDFDERQHAAAPCNHIDLAAGHASPPCENPPAVQAQVPAGEGLGTAPALFGSLAVHLARSRART